MFSTGCGRDGRRTVWIQSSSLLRPNSMTSRLIIAVSCGVTVVIPSKLRQRVLEALHVGHLGIIKMKVLARSYIWWPNMEAAISSWVGSCRVCLESRPPPLVARGNMWETPKAPWLRVHINLAGPFHGKMFLAVVDAYSKWLEVTLM